jgi:hypothetical protein
MLAATEKVFKTLDYKGIETDNYLKNYYLTSLYLLVYMISVILFTCSNYIPKTTRTSRTTTPTTTPFRWF